MPHTRIPPTTVEAILATAEADEEWTTMLETSPIPSGADYELDVLKELSAASYPRMRAALDATKPPDIAEMEISFEIPATQLKAEPATNRAIIVYPQSCTSNSDEERLKSLPLVVLIHGGGHTIGDPESELPLARLLVQHYNAVVILPSYRLAPEHHFPTSFNDSLEVLKQLALKHCAESRPPTCSLPQSFPDVLAGKIDLRQGFIVGGTSAGGTITASITHLYHTWQATQSPSSPPITGIFFSAGSILNPNRIPSGYKPYYLSRKQNATALPVDADLYSIFETATKIDFNSPIWSSIDQKPLLDREKLGEDHMYLKDQGTKVYVQVCGQDMARDDGLIYERMLREECGVDTLIDIYSGFGHVFWGMGGGYATMEMSKKRMNDSVEGIGWLLQRKTL